MTILNPKIKEIIQQFNLDEKDSYFFCLMFWFKKYYPKADELLFTTLKEKTVINLDNEEDYRINFLKLEEGQWTLKYPLFIKEKIEDGKYELFCKYIASTQLINGLGHVNKSQDYSVYSENKIKVYDVTREVRDIFNEINTSIKDFDPIKAAQVVIKYYENTKPAVNIGRYLQESFTIDYKSFD